MLKLSNHQLYRRSLKILQAKAKAEIERQSEIANDGSIVDMLVETTGCPKLECEKALASVKLRHYFNILFTIPAIIVIIILVVTYLVLMY